jgi:hypothetical protein
LVLIVLPVLLLPSPLSPLPWHHSNQFGEDARARPMKSILGQCSSHEEIADG